MLRESDGKFVIFFWKFLKVGVLMKSGACE